MRLIIEDKKKNKEIQLGDIIVLNGDTYMIQKDPHGWVAKDLDGEGGATGRKNTLIELVDSLLVHEIEHYSKDDYDLKLVPKSKN